MNELGLPRASARTGDALVRRWASRIGIAAAVAIAVQVVVGATIWMLGLGNIPPGIFDDAASIPLVLNIFAFLVVAPLLETLLMAWFITLMLERGLHPSVVIVVSALLWAVLHQLVRPLGWLAFFGFLGCSYVYIARNRKAGDGFTVAVLSHFFVNSIATASYLMLGV